MADKKLNELGTTENFDNAYVELSQNQYRISKTNLGKQLTKEVHLNFSVASDTPAYIFAQKSDGTNFRISKKDLANALKSDIVGSGGGGSQSVDTDALYDGCFIMFHDSIDNLPYAVSYADWADFWSGMAEEADGVLIIESGHSLLVAPHEKGCRWSSKTGLATVVVQETNENRISLLDTWNGKELTKKICTDPSSPFKEESKTSTYAPGYCFHYTPHVQNADGDIKNGLTAGNYWLPCVAELMMMYAHKHKINAGLKLINGAQQLSLMDNYWSSTESENGECVWGFNFNDGDLTDTLSKVDYDFKARPVSAFIHDGY